MGKPLFRERPVGRAKDLGFTNIKLKPGGVENEKREDIRTVGLIVLCFDSFRRPSALA